MWPFLVYGLEGTHEDEGLFMVKGAVGTRPYPVSLCKGISRIGFAEWNDPMV